MSTGEKSQLGPNLKLASRRKAVPRQALRSDGPCYVAAIGVSEGEVESLEGLFKSTPPAPAIAFVVYLPSTEAKRRTVKLLSGLPSLIVKHVRNGTMLEPGVIYLIPPKRRMVIIGGRFVREDGDLPVGSAEPIDLLFRSLAVDKGSRAIGILLGTQTEGTQGLADIRASGGVAIIQAQEKATPMDASPCAPSQKGSKDFLLPLEAIPETLRNQIRSHPPAALASLKDKHVAFHELAASNLELRSTNQELKAAIEELRRVNAECANKIAELSDDLDNLLNSSDVGTLVLDRALGIRRFNALIGSAFNLGDADIGRHIGSIGLDLVHRHLLEEMQCVLDSGFPAESEITDREGACHIMRIAPYRSKSKVDGLVLTLVSKKIPKKAEVALDLSKARYRTVVHVLSAHSWSAGKRGEFLAFQQEWADYTGQDWIRQRGRGWINAFHPLERNEVRDAWKRAVENHSLFEVEARVWSKTKGTYRTCISRAAPVLGSDGQIAGWLGRTLDIHERRQAEQELQGILDHAQAAIYLKNLDSTYARVNQYFAALLETDPKQIIGRTEREFLPSRIASLLRRADRTVARTGEVTRQEETIVKDGVEHTFLAVRFPLRDRFGKVTSVAGIWTDITGLKQAQQALQGQALDLERTNELLRQSLARQRSAETRLRDAISNRDRFLATLSHELRNPLGAILNGVRLVEQGSVEAARAAQTIIARQARQMSRLLDDLLDIARVTQGKIVLKRSVMDVRQAIQDAADSLRTTLELRNQTLEIDLGSDPLPVNGDPARLQQINVNLLANASKYTPAGGMIRVVSEQNGDEVIIRVIDNGEGIAPEMIERIFELFEQCRVTLDRSEGGMGVGLTLVRSLVEMHGGCVSAASMGVGHGSTFEVRLPLAAGLAIAARGEAPVVRADGRRLSIVLIEDNSDSRESLRMLLELEGHEVRTARDGLAGLALIEQLRPDVAVVDIGLPVLDGYDLAMRVREKLETRRVYLIALTGYGSASDVDASRRAGFDAHLVKPLKPRELMQLLQSQSSESTPSQEQASERD